MTYRYTYKITCLAGSWIGKFYFGQHTTDNLDDGYFASGIKINKYKQKYGLENCKREILSFYDSQEELNNAEYNLIHPWLNNDMCLNLMEGGNVLSPSIETRKKISESSKGKIISDEQINRHKEFLSEYYKTHDVWNKNKKCPQLNYWEGKHLSEDVKTQIGSSLKKYYKNPENRKKSSERHKGQIPWNKGLKKVTILNQNIKSNNG